MTQPIIEARNLAKRYNLGAIGATSLREETSRLWDRLRGVPHPDAREFWALRDVSFDVNRGEIVGVIGRNGAGKSTLLKILSRITEPTAGRAVLRGRVASLLEVGTGFHPELTGRENVFLNGAILGMTRSEVRKKFDEIVAFAEVDKFIDTPVKRYSSGMYVRLAFAVAAHLEPEILIVDEVLAVGDAAFQKKCISKMGEGKNQGVTTLIVSHNMAVVNNLCNRAILLDAGRVAAVGSVSEITLHYLTSNDATTGQASWPDPASAPGNDIVRLHSVSVLQTGISGPTSDVDIAGDVHVEIQYWNLRPGESLYAAIWLRDSNGTFVLSSVSSHYMSLTADAWDKRPRPTGLFRSVCVLPRNFLNDSIYSVTVILGRGTTDTQITQENVVSFEVHDSGEMRKEFYGNWLGTVRPKLAWSTELLADSKSAHG